MSSGDDPDQSPNRLEAALARVSFSPPSVALLSSVTGRVADSGSLLDGACWHRQAGATEAASARVGSLAELGVDLLVEVSPGAALGPQTRHACPKGSGGVTEARPPCVLARPARAIPQRTRSVQYELCKAVAEACEACLALNFSGLFAGESRRRISLPVYPFQRRRHWI